MRSDHIPGRQPFQTRSGRSRPRHCAQVAHNSVPGATPRSARSSCSPAVKMKLATHLTQRRCLSTKRRAAGSGHRASAPLIGVDFATTGRITHRIAQYCYLRAGPGGGRTEHGLDRLHVVQPVARQSGRPSAGARGPRAGGVRLQHSSGRFPVQHSGQHCLDAA
jgi:hypothetical protein